MKTLIEKINTYIAENSKKCTAAGIVVAYLEGKFGLILKALAAVF